MSWVDGAVSWVGGAVSCVHGAKCLGFDGAECPGLMVLCPGLWYRVSWVDGAECPGWMMLCLG